MWTHFFDWPTKSLSRSFGDANLFYDRHWTTESFDELMYVQILFVRTERGGVMTHQTKDYVEILISTTQVFNIMQEQMEDKIFFTHKCPPTQSSQAHTHIQYTYSYFPISM